MINRFPSSPKGEGDLAVLILPDDAEGAALILPRKLLPPKAKEGSWLTLDIIPEGDMVGGQPRNLKLDPTSRGGYQPPSAVSAT